jgi:hypothetical protein
MHERARQISPALAADEGRACENHAERGASRALAYASPMPLVCLSYARSTMHGLAFSLRICYTEINED